MFCLSVISSSCLVSSILGTAKVFFPLEQAVKLCGVTINYARIKISQTHQPSHEKVASIRLKQGVYDLLRIGTSLTGTELKGKNKKKRPCMGQNFSSVRGVHVNVRIVCDETLDLHSPVLSSCERWHYSHINIVFCFYYLYSLMYS